MAFVLQFLRFVLGSHPFEGWIHKFITLFLVMWIRLDRLEYVGRILCLAFLVHWKFGVPDVFSNHLFQLPALAWLSWHKTGNQFVSIRFNQWFSGFRVVLTEDLPQNGYHDVQFSIVEPLNKNWEPNRLDPPVVVHQCCVPFC